MQYQFRFAACAFVALLCLWSAVGTGAEKKPAANFYTDAGSTSASKDGESKPSKRRSAPAEATKASAKGKTAVAESTPSATTKTVSVASGSRASKRPAEKTPSPKNTAKLKAEQAKVAKAPPAVAAPAIATPGPATKQSRSYRNDIYGLAALVVERWDFVRMLPSLQELAAVRVDSMRHRAEMLRDAFVAFSRATEKRQTNLRNAAMATYILSISRSASPSYLSPGGDLHAAQLAVLRSTLATDAHGLDSMLSIYQSLREVANLSAEELSEAETATTSTVLQWNADEWKPAKLQKMRIEQNTLGITEALSDLAMERSRVILADRVPAADGVRSLLDAEEILRQEEKRETFRSFAPAPPKARPDYNPLIDPGTPMPTNVGSRHSRPDPAPVLQRPVQNAQVLPAPLGSPVLAAADGTVVMADEVRGLGRTVLIQHDGEVVSLYGYLSSFDCAEGDTVQAGQPVGRAGTIPGTKTGGIRFEVRRGRNSIPVTELLGNADLAGRVVGR